MSAIYRQPAGKIEPLKTLLQNIFTKNIKSNKTLYLVGDFNLNILTYDSNNKVRNFFNFIFQNGLIPVINRPTRITRTKATAIDHIITNSHFNSDIKTGIIKADISDHFPIFLISEKRDIDIHQDKITIYKRHFNDVSINAFKNLLQNVNWNKIYTQEDANKAYNLFLNLFLNCYEKAFPIIKLKIKTKTFLSPWMTKGILKSSKKKQKLYEKFLKHRTVGNLEKYKNYKNLFEMIKRRSKKNYYNSLISQYKNSIKKTWDIIKEVTGKRKLKQSALPRKLFINGTETCDSKIIAENFNIFFTQIGPSLASNIPNTCKHFQLYLNKNDKILQKYELSEEEFKKAFFSLKSNKSNGFDDINANVVKQIYTLIKRPLIYIFNCSIQKGIFPDKLKIARVTPIFKSGEETVISNYRPISVLPCFSKILEKIMYNRLYPFFRENKILYEKQFGFQANHSTDHAIVQLSSEIYESFNKKEFTLGVFIDLSKAFDTVDHKILFKKLENYGVKDSYLKWFISYLTSRKQFIAYNRNQTDLIETTCGVPQGSILGPLLFLIYVNDLHKATELLNTILFADDTNLFYSHTNIKILFDTMNKELNKIAEWFKANKLSLNATKTRYTFFHSSAKNDYIPLKLPDLYINNINIKREHTMKFLGIMFDENLTWKNHINLINNKISKNIGILYKVKFLLSKKCLKSIYFSFIHSYLNYANMVWASTNQSKLKKLFNKQKHARRIVFNEKKYTHARPLMKKLKALNVYQINIFQILIFMFKVKHNLVPAIFKTKFQLIHHKYPSRYSTNNFIEPKVYSKSTSFSVTYRGPSLWNKYLDEETKSLLSLPTFKRNVRHKILNSEKEGIYF